MRFTSIISIFSPISFYITSLPTTLTAVEAFRSPLSSSIKLLSSFLPHRDLQVLRPPATASMSTRTSLKESTSDDNASSLSSSSSSSSSILTVIITKIGSTTSTVVAGTFFVALCYKRDALMVSFFLGAICNAVFGKVLKKILKIERPVDVDGDDNADRPNDNGMPSSHAMSLGFICTFVALLVPTTALPLLIYAGISLVYRVRVNLHTVDQIAVGAFLGTFDGAVWWHLCAVGFGGGLNVIELISSSGIMNEHGLLPWYLLAVPALIGAAVVGSVERRLGKYFRSGSSDDDDDDDDDGNTTSKQD